MNSTEETTMSNVSNILDARMNKILRKFNDGLDSTWRSTIAKYSEDCNDPRVNDVLDALFDTVRSRSETQTNLILRGAKTKNDEEFAEIQTQLDASPLPVVEAFYEKVKSAGDLEDPLVRAAIEYLVQFLRLENEYCCEYFGAFATHFQLRCDRQPPKTSPTTKCSPKKMKTDTQT